MFKLLKSACGLIHNRILPHHIFKPPFDSLFFLVFLHRSIITRNQIKLPSTLFYLKIAFKQKSFLVKLLTENKAPLAASR